MLVTFKDDISRYIRLVYLNFSAYIEVYIVIAAFSAFIDIILIDSKYIFYYFICIVYIRIKCAYQRLKANV